MNLTEMHVWFRQYAQQMGMQNVRAILPEQIDLLINTSITDIINQLIRESISVTNDRIITDNSKLGQVNAFKTLYHVDLIDLCPTPIEGKEYRAFHFSAKDRNTGKLSTQFARIPTSGTNPPHYETNIPESFFIVDFSLNYRQVENGKGYSGNNKSIIKFDVMNAPANGGYLAEDWDNESEYDLTVSVDGNICVVSAKYYNGFLKITECEDDPYFVGTILLVNLNEDNGDEYLVAHPSKIMENFTSTNKRWNPICNVRSIYLEPQPTIDEDSLETNFFPVRIIDDIYLADTLNDFLLKPRLRSPIMVVYKHGTEQVMDLYIDKFKKVGDRYVLDHDLIPYQLRMSYIAAPAKVEYKADMGEPNIDCDLPEAMHIDILKHAVDLYRVATSGALHANQGQNGQQEAPNNSQQ